MAAEVHFIIRGRDVDEPVRAACFLDRPFKLSDVKAALPYQGTYHFRQKVSGKLIGAADLEYAWIDLRKDEETIYAESDIVEITAIALDVPLSEDADPDGQYGRYLDALAAELEANDLGPNARPIRMNYNKSHLFGASLQDASALLKQININNVSKAAANIWSSVISTASTIGNLASHATGQVPNEPWALNMSTLANELDTTFDSSNATHDNLLQDVWTALFPGEPYVASGPKWKEAGFQKPEPTADLKNSGVLPLHCIAFMGHNFSVRTAQMVQSQRANSKANYPFAIVAVNITLMMADVMGLRDQRYLLERQPYTAMFRDPNCFFEIFCMCFFHLDRVWTSTNAVRADFGKIMTELKAVLSRSLNHGPDSLDAFASAAGMEGLQFQE